MDSMDVSARENKILKLVLFDVTNIGTDWMDVLFNTQYVFLCERFTLNNPNEEEGVDITELPHYCGWDYIVILYAPELKQMTDSLMAGLGIPKEKIIYINSRKIICENYQEIKYIFRELPILRSEAEFEQKNNRIKLSDVNAPLFWIFISFDQESIRVLYDGFGREKSTGSYYLDPWENKDRVSELRSMINNLKRMIPDERIPVFILYARVYETYREAILLLRKTFPDGYTVIYYGDLIDKHRFKIEEAYNDGADYIFAFDEKDALDHNVLYLQEPLSGLGALSSDKEAVTAAEFDVLFVGYAKERLAKILKTYEVLSAAGLRCEFYIAGVEENDMKYPDRIHYNQWLDYSDIIRLDIKSRCLLEILQNDESYSPTTRFSEARLLKKRILTNCTALKECGDPNVIYYEDVHDIDFMRIREPYEDNGIDYEHFYSVDAMLRSICLAVAEIKQ